MECTGRSPAAEELAELYASACSDQPQVQLWQRRCGTVWANGSCKAIEDACCVAWPIDGAIPECSHRAQCDALREEGFDPRNCD